MRKAQKSYHKSGKRGPLTVFECTCRENRTKPIEIFDSCISHHTVVGSGAPQHKQGILLWEIAWHVNQTALLGSWVLGFAKVKGIVELLAPIAHIHVYVITFCDVILVHTF